MLRTIYLTLVFLLIPFASHSQERGYEVIGGMPTFYGELKATLTYPLAWGNAPDTDFDAWRNHARAQLLECMSSAPPKADAFNAEILEEEQREGYVAKKLLLNLSAWSRVPAYLLVPDGVGRCPAVLLLHDHGAHFTIGKEKMIRPFGVSEDILQDAQKWSEKYFEGQFIGDYLAANGYVVLAVDALLWGDRGRKEGALYDAQQVLSANLLQMGMSFGGLIVWDDVRSAEFLATLPCVDPDRVGAMGFSMGAHRAWMTAAATDVVRAAASVCWMCTTDSLMTMTNNQNKGGSAYAMIIPGIRRYLDYPHVASIACPRPMLFINGSRDKLFPIDGVRDAFEEMRKVWDSQGATDQLETCIYDVPHSCGKSIQEHVLRFFDKQFKR